jgi:hypothetical protein
LLRASKSPAEHVGRLVYNKKSSLHRFTWTGDTVTVKQVPVRPSKIIHITWILQTSDGIRDAGPVPVGNLFGKLCFVQCFEDSWQTTLTCQFTFVVSVRFAQIPHANNWHTLIPI